MSGTNTPERGFQISVGVRRSWRCGRAARARPQLLLLAGIACLAGVIDCIASQWSAVYTSESIGAGESWGAATYTLMMVLKGVAPLFVDRLPARFGWQRIFRVSMLASGGAFALCLAVPSLTTARSGS